MLAALVSYLLLLGRAVAQDQSCNLNRCMLLNENSPAFAKHEKVNFTISEYSPTSSTAYYQATRIWSFCNGHSWEAQSEECAAHIDTLDVAETRLINHYTKNEVCTVGPTCSKQSPCKLARESCSDKAYKLHPQSIKNGHDTLAVHSLRWDPGEWTCNQEWKCVSLQLREECVRCKENAPLPCLWSSKMNKFLTAPGLQRVDGVTVLVPSCTTNTQIKEMDCKSSDGLTVCNSRDLVIMYNQETREMLAPSSYLIEGNWTYKSMGNSETIETISEKIGEIAGELASIRNLAMANKAVISPLLKEATERGFMTVVGTMKYLLMLNSESTLVACPCGQVRPTPYSTCLKKAKAKGFPPTLVSMLCPTPRELKKGSASEQLLWKEVPSLSLTPHLVSIDPERGYICKSCLPEESFIDGAVTSIKKWWKEHNWVELVVLAIFGYLALKLANILVTLFKR